VNTIGTVRVVCLQRCHNRAARGQDNVRRERDQFRRVAAIALRIADAPTSVDPHVAAVSPAQFLQPLHERRKAGVPFRIARSQRHERADASHPLGLLRARRQWQCHNSATDQRYEFTPPHAEHGASPPLVCRTLSVPQERPRVPLDGSEWS
jgi:hypothetical protein